MRNVLLDANLLIAVFDQSANTSQSAIANLESLYQRYLNASRKTTTQMPEN